MPVRCCGLGLLLFHCTLHWNRISSAAQPGPQAHKLCLRTFSMFSKTSPRRMCCWKLITTRQSTFIHYMGPTRRRRCGVWRIALRAMGVNIVKWVCWYAFCVCVFFMLLIYYGNKKNYVFKRFSRGTKFYFMAYQSSYFLILRGASSI